MKLLSHIPAWLKNKYFISLAAFATIILFFDKNDMVTQFSRVKELNELNKSKAYYNEQIALESKELEQLRTNPATLEKYAREKYMMKRDNEDLFIISDAKKQEKINQLTQ